MGATACSGVELRTHNKTPSCFIGGARCCGYADAAAVDGGCKRSQSGRLACESCARMFSWYHNARHMVVVVENMESQCVACVSSSARSKIGVLGLHTKSKYFCRFDGGYRGRFWNGDTFLFLAEIGNVFLWLINLPLFYKIQLSVCIPSGDVTAHAVLWCVCVCVFVCVCFWTFVIPSCNLYWLLLGDP